jgi:ribosome-associated protein
MRISPRAQTSCAALDSIPTVPRPPAIVIPEHEMELFAVRARGPGGQNVQKVSNAAHLRFDIRSSSLPQEVKARLLARGDRRVTGAGVVVIKAQRHRSLEMNRAEAIERLHALVAGAAAVPKARRPTRAPRAARERRIEAKRRRAQLKAQRAKVGF